MLLSRKVFLPGTINYVTNINKALGVRDYSYNVV